MEPLNLAEPVAVARRKAAARLPQSKKGRSELRPYKWLPGWRQRGFQRGGSAC